MIKYHYYARAKQARKNKLVFFKLLTVYIAFCHLSLDVSLLNTGFCLLALCVQTKYSLNTVYESGVFHSYIYLRNYRCFKMISTCKMHVKWIMFKFSLRFGNDCVKLINHLSTDRPIMDCDTLKLSVDTYSSVVTYKKLTSSATTNRG